MVSGWLVFNLRKGRNDQTSFKQELKESSIQEFFWEITMISFLTSSILGVNNWKILQGWGRGKGQTWNVYAIIYFVFEIQLQWHFQIFKSFGLLGARKTVVYEPWGIMKVINIQFMSNIKVAVWQYNHKVSKIQLISGWITDLWAVSSLFILGRGSHTFSMRLWNCFCMIFFFLLIAWQWATKMFSKMESEIPDEQLAWKIQF